MNKITTLIVMVNETISDFNTCKEALEKACYKMHRLLSELENIKHNPQSLNTGGHDEQCI